MSEPISSSGSAGAGQVEYLVPTEEELALRRVSVGELIERFGPAGRRVRMRAFWSRHNRILQLETFLVGVFLLTILFFSDLWLNQKLSTSLLFIFLVPGIILPSIALGISSGLRRDYRLLKNGLITEGLIHERVVGLDESVIFRYHFLMANGQKFEGRQLILRKSVYVVSDGVPLLNSLGRGNIVAILFNPENPEESVIVDFIPRNMIAIRRVQPRRVRS